MGINPVLAGIIVYLIIGSILLLIFDLITKRISSKFAQATNETQSRLIASGNYVGNKIASILFLGAMWLFWPVVFIGALTDKTDKKEDSHGS